MKIFITGGSGLLGQYLNIGLNGKHEILTQYCSNPGNCIKFNSVRLSLEDFDGMEKIFNSFHPEIVIHAAAVSNAEKADQLPADKVYNINVNATLKISELCAKYSSKLIYFSTDLVYAGYRGSTLKEDAKLIPISLYAETKLMGEMKIKQTFDNYIILREALLIGFGLNHTTNNFHKMYASLKRNEPVTLFTDQFRSPLALHEAARMIEELSVKNISGEIFNFCGNERLSRYELGEILCEETGFDKNLLTGKTMEERKLNYKVADVSLNNEKLRSYGIQSKGVRDSIKEILAKGL
ncbi:MAG: NAD(P)-dependent oxidoreductase [Ignavibacteriae bacterium HGW-Ignavibacteriae-3]|nr:MAG: NAD(P)-dependent oxidoreductase [Ignavibacteriae bacterium HGW-Ignavibacteriae-3]